MSNQLMVWAAKRDGVDWTEVGKNADTEEIRHLYNHRAYAEAFGRTGETGVGLVVLDTIQGLCAEVDRLQKPSMSDNNHATGVNIRQTLIDAGITTAEQFANGLPYIEVIDHGKYGGEFRLCGDFTHVEEFSKKDRNDAFDCLRVWVRFKYGIKEFEKTPFGTWQERGTTRSRILEILSES